MRPPKPPVWFPWVLGGALLVVVVVAALHYSEQKQILRLMQRAEPWWLVAAALLQVMTYAVESGIWLRVGDAAGSHLSRREAFNLSVAKLFVDQAIPSAGVGSGIFMAKALELRRMPEPAVKAAVLLNFASFYLSYVIAMVIALVILVRHGHAHGVILITSIVSLVFASAVSALLLALSGHGLSRTAGWLRQLPILRRMHGYLSEADPKIVRGPRILRDTILLQLAIVVLDVSTIWTLIASFGIRAPLGGVFTSFMVASMVRMMGFLPGGLGSFEASCVLMLRLAGIDLPVALSATLLFRGLSFWLPMLPGWWLAHRAVTPASDKAAEEDEGPPLRRYWSLDTSVVMKELAASPGGLTAEDAKSRLERYGPNALREHRRVSPLGVLGRQLKSPLLLLLVFAAIVSALTAEWIDASIVIAIVIATVGIGASREYKAEVAAAALRAQLKVRSTVVRDGKNEPVPAEEIVPGDVVLLAAGSLVPADAVVLESTDFYVSEAALTGESFPVVKKPGTVARNAELSERANCVFLGTNARSGTARCLVVATGGSTVFGGLARKLALRAPETDFDRGIRRFGYLLTEAMLILVFLVFAAHVWRGRPPSEVLLFAVALAVGLSPELLPAILSVNLARGAQMMAGRGVLVRRLNAIENLGSMNVLCTDKTGTLTEGVVQVEGAYGPGGENSTEVERLAGLNGALETGVSSPLDEAITAAFEPDLTKVRKLGEIPFDFTRKRVTVAVREPDGVRLVTKGAFHHVLEVTSRTADGAPLDDAARDALERRYDDWSGRGIRVLAIAVKSVGEKPSYGRDDEAGMDFAGFVTFLDRPKPGVREAVDELAALGVSLKMITGDSRLVAQHVAGMVGLRCDRVLTGREIQDMREEALWATADETDLFAEVDPNQKERIILALKKRGRVVGFLGDGVNDAPAMHAADTSLSVDQAVDVAREAADFVLLERSLDVIRRGIEAGRTTFANTLKYILITTSANLGNMISMAVASLFLPFLPLTAGQILLNNFLSDVPAIGIADDSVDPEQVERPPRWDIKFIGRYMVQFGVLSSAFDFLTFGALLHVFHAPMELFRTGWFVESLLTELVVVLVMRTRRPFWKSRPGKVLWISTVALIAFTFVIPYIPGAAVFGFVPLPPPLVGMIAGITVAYVLATEVLKRWFYRGAQRAQA